MSGGAGIGGTWSRGPFLGDATVEPITGASHRRSSRAAGGQIPEGPSSAPRRAPLAGMRPAKDAEPPTPCLISCDAMPEAAA
jgi:hypothetical protein